MLILQFAAAASVLPHVVVLMLKSPLICGMPNVAVEPPMFVAITFSAALFAPIVVLAKLSDAGASVTSACDTPTPLSDADNVPLLPPLMDICPLRVPIAVGENSTASEQLAATASVLPQVFALIMKSPSICGVPNVATDPPVFETITPCAALLVPTV